MHATALPRIDARRAGEVWIGLDCGASVHKAYALELAPSGDSIALAPRGSSALVNFAAVDGFAPLPVAEQLEQQRTGAFAPSAAEQASARAWIACASAAVLAVARASGARSVRLGLCAPGLKSADGRGLIALANGPRVPRFAAELEQALAAADCALVQPLARIHGDARACVEGERSPQAGLLRELDCAWLIAGGTGLGEALLSGARACDFEDFGGRLRRAYELPAPEGGSCEQAIAPGALARAHAQASGRALPLREHEQPERCAERGEAHAAELLARAARALASLLVERVLALHSGALAPLVAAGSVPQRIALVQRLGALHARDSAHAFFAAPFERACAEQLAQRAPNALRAALLEQSSEHAAPRLRAGWIASPGTRAAPAIGAFALEQAASPARL